MVHTVAQNVELRVTKAWQRDRHLVGAVTRAYARSVDGEHDVAGMKRAAPPTAVRR